MFGYTWSTLNELLCTIILQQIIIILVLISSSFNINNFFDINWKLIYFKVQVCLMMMKTQTVVLDSCQENYFSIHFINGWWVYSVSVTDLLFVYLFINNDKLALCLTWNWSQHQDLINLLLITIQPLYSRAIFYEHSWRLKTKAFNFCVDSLFRKSFSCCYKDLILIENTKK